MNKAKLERKGVYCERCDRFIAWCTAYTVCDFCIGAKQERERIIHIIDGELKDMCNCAEVDRLLNSIKQEIEK